MGRKNSKKEEMLGVIFDSTSKDGPVVDSDDADYRLEYRKGDDYFSVYEKEVKFYKGVEKIVRQDQFYRTTWPKYLKEVVGLTECQVFGHIEDTDRKQVSMEIHHGPLLTLYDICEIVTTAVRRRGQKPTTLTIADLVLEEHRANRVQVVKLSKSAHQAVTDGELHLNYNQGTGDVKSFLEKYHDGLTPDIARKINRELAWSKEHDTDDHEVFALTERMREWDNDLLFDDDEDEDKPAHIDFSNTEWMQRYNRYANYDREYLEERIHPRQGHGTFESPVNDII